MYSIDFRLNTCADFNVCFTLILIFWNLHWIIVRWLCYVPNSINNLNINRNVRISVIHLACICLDWPYYLAHNFSIEFIHFLLLFFSYTVSLTHALICNRYAVVWHLVAEWLAFNRSSVDKYWSLLAAQSETLTYKYHQNDSIFFPMQIDQRWFITVSTHKI